MIPYEVTSGDVIAFPAKLGGAHLVAGSAAPATLTVYDNLGSSTGTILYQLGAVAGGADSSNIFTEAYTGVRCVLSGVDAKALVYMR